METRTTGMFKSLQVIAVLKKMIDKSKIPEPILSDLIELFGEEKAEKILDNRLYNFQAITILILKEKFRRRFGFRLEIIFIIIALIAIYLIFFKF